MMRHALLNGTLKREPEGITARCECGWASTHFTALTASAAFLDHQEREAERAARRSHE